MMDHQDNNHNVTEESNIVTAVAGNPLRTIQCTLQHHGAAASISGNQAVTWMPHSDTVVYASHALLNLAVRTPIQLHTDNQESTAIRHVETTLRTMAFEKDPTLSSSSDGSNATIITTVVTLKHHRQCGLKLDSLASGFSNGMIQIWTQQQQQQDATAANQWMEHDIVVPENSEHHSITVLDGIWMTDSELWIVAGTSAGATLYQIQWPKEMDRKQDDEEETSFQLIQTWHLSDHIRTSVFSVHFGPTSRHSMMEEGNNEESCIEPLVLLIGTASPRHNKIHVYQYDPRSSNKEDETHAPCKPAFQYVGFLSGHENWITDLAFGFGSSSMDKNNSDNPLLLASASQDCRIRLWKFRSSTSKIVSNDDNDRHMDGTIDDLGENDNNEDDDDFEHNDEIEDDEEGESRLEIITGGNNKDSSILVSTSVTLEAILYGHEESVTSVTWHPKPMSVYGVSALLISSSMDRTILLWSESTTDGGVWTPLSRVGSAGGILGGSIGSSLLGFCKVLVEPIQGRTLLGHAYGGTIHAWELDQLNDNDATILTDITPEERASHVQWKAAPCITGHFRGVTDLCWEASSGEYLLSVSNDQTCRLWAPLLKSTDNDRSNSDHVWVELARPQVHGYNLSTVASLSTKYHPHQIVTGADEKEIRVFDAPKTTVRVLRMACGIAMENDVASSYRVERAFIPSLGLSNKASATDAAEEDSSYNRNSDGFDALSVNRMQLPLERDLGAVSLWPEVQKLFGHNTEIYCLASMLAAKTAAQISSQENDIENFIVASSAKARDEKDAAIRLWNIAEGRCVQILVGGHKSTVSTLAFSPDGQFLASSGKDRRLCLWRREPGQVLSFSLACTKDSAHKRIIWSVHFRPFGSLLFASGSRDGTIKIWTVDNEAKVCVNEIHNFAPLFCNNNSKPDAVTALSFAPLPCPGDTDTAILSVGMECGRIELWKVDAGLNPPVPLLNLNPSIFHIASVTKMVWRPFCRPRDESAGDNTVTLYLASSSMDNGCRIFNISF